MLWVREMPNRFSCCQSSSLFWTSLKNCATWLVKKAQLKKNRPSTQRRYNAHEPNNGTEAKQRKSRSCDAVPGVVALCSVRSHGRKWQLYQHFTRLNSNVKRLWHGTSRECGLDAPVGTRTKFSAKVLQLSHPFLGGAESLHAAKYLLVTFQNISEKKDPLNRFWIPLTPTNPNTHDLSWHLIQPR